MKEGTKVSWKPKTANTGWGYTITDEHNGHVLVAVHSEGELHRVIYCATTWLTVLEAPAQPELVAAKSETWSNPYGEKAK